MTIIPPTGQHQEMNMKAGWPEGNSDEKVAQDDDTKQHGHAYLSVYNSGKLQGLSLITVNCPLKRVDNLEAEKVRDLKKKKLIFYLNQYSYLIQGIPKYL